MNFKHFPLNLFSACLCRRGGRVRLPRAFGRQPHRAGDGRGVVRKTPNLLLQVVEPAGVRFEGLGRLCPAVRYLLELGHTERDAHGREMTREKDEAWSVLGVERGLTCSRMTRGSRSRSLADAVAS